MKTIKYVKTTEAARISKIEMPRPIHYFEVDGEVFFIASFKNRAMLFDADGYPELNREMLSAVIEEAKSLSLAPVNGHQW